MKERLEISFACGLYDRVLPLYSKKVLPKSFDIDFKDIDDPRVIFDRQAGSSPQYDASEMSSSEYLVRLSKGDRTFAAIPVFPSRVFRHGFICVNSNIIRKPSDLEGKRIGIQLYTMTAAVWIRSILRDEYGVDLSKVQWIQGEIEHAGTHGTPKDMSGVPANIVLNTSGKSLDELLVEGSLAAVVGADLPPSLGVVPHVKRLFPDYKEREKLYFKQRGIFPIMHLVVIRRDIVDANPEIARELYDVLHESKEIALRQMKVSNPLPYMLPWLQDAIEETEEVFGKDLWSYGVQDNLQTLQTMVNALYKDGLIKRIIPLEEMFPFTDVTSSKEPST